MLSLETFQYYTTNLWAKITDKFMTKDEAVNGVLLDPQWEIVETVQNNNTITLPQLDTFDELYIVMDNGESTVIHQTDIKKESLVTENENVTYREILLDTLYDAETYATYYPETNTVVPSVCEGVTIDETTSITTTVYVKKYNGVDFSNLSATLVSYDDSISGLDATDVQSAIEKLDERIDNAATGDFLEKENPTGTGSFSMNRMVGSEVGDYSTALGLNNTASGIYSFAEGYSNTASKGMSHAEGGYTISSGQYSHSEGVETRATSQATHAEGAGSQAINNEAHAEGYYTIAGGAYSHAEGRETYARGDAQHTQGKYNIEDWDNTYAHIVGNGTDSNNRSNAHTLDWDGNAWFAGDVTATNSNGDSISLCTLNATIGDINSILDNINGEVI